MILFILFFCLTTFSSPRFLSHFAASPLLLSFKGVFFKNNSHTSTLISLTKAENKKNTHSHKNHKANPQRWEGGTVGGVLHAANDKYLVQTFTPTHVRKHLVGAKETEPRLHFSQTCARCLDTNRLFYYYFSLRDVFIDCAVYLRAALCEDTTASQVLLCDSS